MKNKGLILLVLFLLFSIVFPSSIMAITLPSFYCGDRIVSNSPDVSVSEQCDSGTTDSEFTSGNCNVPGSVNECQCYSGYTVSYNGNILPNCCPVGAQRNASGACCALGQVVINGVCTTHLCGNGILDSNSPNFEKCDVGQYILPNCNLNLGGEDCNINDDKVFRCFTEFNSNVNSKFYCQCPRFYRPFDVSRDSKSPTQVKSQIQNEISGGDIYSNYYPIIYNHPNEPFDDPLRISKLVFPCVKDCNPKAESTLLLNKSFQSTPSSSRKAYCNVDFQELNSDVPLWPGDESIQIHLSISAILVNPSGNVVYTESTRQVNTFIAQHFNYTFSYSVNANSPALRCIVNITDVTASSQNSPCNFTQQVTSNWLTDYDGDGINSTSQGGTDCNDWPFAGRICEGNFGAFQAANNKQTFCNNDADNDGAGDLASCSYCINLNMLEVADDVDNDCKGHCQGNVSKFCNISSYMGDGANDPSNCRSVVNQYNISDSFCQMVDDQVKVGDGYCGGYNRAVKYGYLAGDNLSPYSGDTISDTQLVAESRFCFDLGQTCYINGARALIFKPGGVSTGISLGDFGIVHTNPSLFDDLRAKDTMIGFYQFVDRYTKTILGDMQNEKLYIELSRPGVGSSASWLDSQPDSSRLYEDQKNFISSSNIEAQGKSRGTPDLPDEYIDSFRGELNKKINAGYSLFDAFYSYEGYLIKSRDASGNFKFKWQTACVPKDKCNDHANNNGKQDIYSVQPFASIFKPITGLEISGANSDFGNSDHKTLFLPLTDVDDPSCKFNSDGETAIADQYNLLKNAEINGGSPSISPIALLNYNINPQTNNPYCTDLDGDGFCGNNGAVKSLQYPDCMDSSANLPDWYTDANGINFNNRKTNTATGYGKLVVPFSAWFVHPNFNSIAQEICSFASPAGGTDMNCNKNGLAGKDFISLNFGGTPFDSDLRTGMEINQRINFVGVDITNTLEREVTSDMACTLRPEGEATAQMFVGIAGGSVEIAKWVTGFGVAGRLLVKGGASENLVNKVFAALFISQVPSIITAVVNDITLSRSRTLQENIVAGYNDAINVIFMATMITPAMPTMNAKGNKLKMIIDTKSIAVDEIPEATTPVPRSSKVVEDASSKGKVATPATGCFLANTSVIMADKTKKNIQDIKLGDLVLAWDLENNKAVNAPITTFFVRNETKYLNIEYEEVK